MSENDLRESLNTKGASLVNIKNFSAKQMSLNFD